MSPTSKAAVRVASLAMRVKVAWARLCCGRPHQLGLATKVARTPGSHSRSMKGPVPLAWRVA
jgi:hypothetical protein